MCSVPESVRTVKDPTIPTGEDDFDGPTPEAFVGWLRDQAERIRLQATPDALWLADRIGRLSDLARFLAAPDGPSFDEREEIQERARDRELLEARHGFAVCRN